MRSFHTIALPDSTSKIPVFLRWAHQHYSHIALLNSNGHEKDPYKQHNGLLAVGINEEITPGEGEDAFAALQHFSEKHNDWLFGFLSYDLKNQLEDLTSGHTDGIKMPLMHFFVPTLVFIFHDDYLEVGLLNNLGERIDPDALIRQILQARSGAIPQKPLQVQHRVSKEDYIGNVRKIKNYIQAGDIYEANYCIEFFSSNAEINPVETSIGLNQTNPSPFSCFYRHGEKYLISSSPERYLAKRGQKLISQPIKGTIKRGRNPEEDELLKQKLFDDPKERSENVMIVDLVRNDLSRTASRGSVRVEELFGIYTYPRVHQMISTVTSQLHQNAHYIDVLRKSFPMGSMTGAPKIRAMQIIEECEITRRGLYSGAVGYISPDKDFDFNVIIRSILYNHSEKFLSFMAGSAITIESEPEKEYEECLLKAGSMAQAIGGRL